MSWAWHSSVIKIRKTFTSPMGKQLLSFTGPARCLQVLHPKLLIDGLAQRVQYLQCISNGDAVVLHLVINKWSTTLLSGFQSCLQWDERGRCLGEGPCCWWVLDLDIKRLEAICWVCAELQPTWLTLRQLGCHIHMFNEYAKCNFLQDWANYHRPWACKLA